MLNVRDVGNAYVTVREATGYRVIGGYRLDFPLRFHWSDVNEKHRSSVRAIEWDLHVGSNPVKENWFARAVRRGGGNTPRGGAFFDVTLTADVDAACIARLDALRTNGDLFLCGPLTLSMFDDGWVSIKNGELGWNPPRFLSSVDPAVTLRIAGSDWAALLKNLDVRDTILFEIEVPSVGAVAAPLEEAAKHLREAHGLFLAGHYDEAGGLCRDAYDVLETALNDPLPQGGQKTSWSFSQRVRNIRDAARHLTHLGKHKGATGGVSWNRTDAHAMLAITASLLAVCSQPPK